MRSGAPCEIAGRANGNAATAAPTPAIFKASRRVNRDLLCMYLPPSLAITASLAWCVRLEHRGAVSFVRSQLPSSMEALQVGGKHVSGALGEKGETPRACWQPYRCAAHDCGRFSPMYYNS